MCSPVVLGLGVRPEDDTRPVEADDVRLGHNMTDDISTYLSLSVAGGYAISTKKMVSMMDNRRPPAPGHVRATTRVPDVLAALWVRGCRADVRV